MKCTFLQNYWRLSNDMLFFPLKSNRRRFRIHSTALAKMNALISKVLIIKDLTTVCTILSGFNTRTFCEINTANSLLGTQFPGVQVPDSYQITEYGIQRLLVRSITDFSFCARVLVQAEMKGEKLQYLLAHSQTYFYPYLHFPFVYDVVQPISGHIIYREESARC